MTRNELSESFKWLNVADDLELGSYGYMNEGWVDPRKYLLAVRKKATAMGAEFVNGELIGFESADPKIDSVDIHATIKPLKSALVGFE